MHTCWFAAKYYMKSGSGSGAHFQRQPRQLGRLPSGRFHNFISTPFTKHTFVRLSPLPQNAARGQGVLRVSNSSQFTPGQWVRLVMDAPSTGA